MWNKTKKSFTLIEVLITVLILTVGILGMLGVFVRILVYSRLISSRLIAAYLAQEGIELIRNLRDKNYLQGREWDADIPSGDLEMDYNDPLPTFWSGSGRFLKVSQTTGIYSYDSGDNTIFKRKISISKNPDFLSINVEVSWTEKGVSYKLNASERLYNWYE